jgi:hypothetical protein
MTCKQGSAIKKLGQNRVTCNNATASKTKKEKKTTWLQKMKNKTQR